MGLIIVPIPEAVVRLKIGSIYTVLSKLPKTRSGLSKLAVAPVVVNLSHGHEFMSMNSNSYEFKNEFMSYEFKNS